MEQKDCKGNINITNELISSDEEGRAHELFTQKATGAEDWNTSRDCLEREREGHPRHPQTQTPASTEDYNTIDREEFS